jgi:tRNA nucleotidyltransferase (CCA-adding enzyme)
VGVDLLDDLFALRAADDVASGVEEPPDGWLELRERVAAAVANDPLGTHQLAVSGDDLVSELGIAPGPPIGQLLARLLEAVLEDPSLNSRDRLLELARAMASG